MISISIFILSLLTVASSQIWRPVHGGAGELIYLDRGRSVGESYGLLDPLPKERNIHFSPDAGRVELIGELNLGSESGDPIFNYYDGTNSVNHDHFTSVFGGYRHRFNILTLSITGEYLYEDRYTQNFDAFWLNSKGHYQKQSDPSEGVMEAWRFDVRAEHNRGSIFWHHDNYGWWTYRDSERGPLIPYFVDGQTDSIAGDLSFDKGAIFASFSNRSMGPNVTASPSDTNPLSYRSMEVAYSYEHQKGFSSSLGYSHDGKLKSGRGDLFSAGVGRDFSNGSIATKISAGPHISPKLLLEAERQLPYGAVAYAGAEMEYSNTALRDRYLYSPHEPFSTVIRDERSRTQSLFISYRDSLPFAQIFSLKASPSLRVATNKIERQLIESNLYADTLIYATSDSWQLQPYGSAELAASGGFWRKSFEVDLAAGSPQHLLFKSRLSLGSRSDSTLHGEILLQRFSNSRAGYIVGEMPKSERQWVNELSARVALPVVAPFMQPHFETMLIVELGSIHPFTEPEARESGYFTPWETVFRVSLQGRLGWR